MKINGRILNNIHEFSLKHWNDKAKLPDESESQYRSRCWLLGIQDAFAKEGYNVQAVSITTGERASLELESSRLSADSKATV